MLLQVALNGNRDATAHPQVPADVALLTADAQAAVSLGARAVHLHPRDADRRETLAPEVIDATVLRFETRAGFRSGEWIEPDPELRVRLVQAWRAPDYASVNLSEAGALEVMAACERAGVGIEAGVWSARDAELLAESRFAATVVRVLVELIDLSAEEAGRRANAIHGALDQVGVTASRLQHGEGEATWPMMHDALGRDLDVRIGLEDTLELPDGLPAKGNADLVRAASELVARYGRQTSLR